MIPCLFLLLCIILTTQNTTATPPYTATDFILLSCGASANVNDTNNRLWNSDESSRYAPSNAATISSASSAFSMESSVFQVPYSTARVFRSPFAYTFPLSGGQKFLRLYFYPNTYSNSTTSQSFFSLTANRFTLLTNFSAYLYSKNSSQPSFMKEFVINVEENQRLVLTFSPIPDSFAFVNGIEIVSIPDKLYFQGNGVPINSVGQQYYLNDNTALERVYRLNVGGAYVDINGDTGMFRAWSPDDEYIYFSDVGWTPHLRNVQINYTTRTPPYTAPPIVYTTARVMSNISISLEWSFPVDSGSLYLLRLHFCEYTLEVRKRNERVFDILINNQTVDMGADVIFWTGGPDIPIFMDYMFWVPNDKQDLRLSLFPSVIMSRPLYHSALLNGLEIFKLNDTEGSLAAPNPELVIDSSPLTQPGVPPQNKKKRGPYAVVGSVVGVLAVLAAISFFTFWLRHRKLKGSVTTSKSWILLSLTPSRSTRTSGSGVSLPSNICRYFSLDDIKTATHNLDDNLVIGKGGFGKVYKGLIDDATTTVAIKRLGQSSSQGVGEFLTEIKMLSKLRHLNLVSLIGYCDQYGEMILVYDYMAHGTLRSHLYNSQHPPLTWNQRLQICIGAAKGLHYLHTGAEPSIIHRDIKTSNILLDEKWVAKISDFGLSKVGPTGGDHTHVSTVVKGSSGYVDPEYYRRRQLTEKSDVYSFGVVLFEVLCGRAAVVPSHPRGEANLAEWAQSCYQEGSIEHIVDANLNGQITAECLNKFVETAAACVRGTGIERPTMNDVVWCLELALQLQEAAENEGHSNMNFITLSPSHGDVEPIPKNVELFSRSSEVSGSKSTDFSRSEIFFSDIIKPFGG